jgi:hypothetical protein
VRASEQKHRKLSKFRAPGGFFGSGLVLFPLHPGKHQSYFLPAVPGFRISDSPLRLFTGSHFRSEGHLSKAAKLRHLDRDEAHSDSLAYGFGSAGDAELPQD